MGTSTFRGCFYRETRQYVTFSPNKVIVEIGPGYGRLLQSCLDARLPFAHYYGVDMSSANCAYLAKRFNQPNVHFINAEAESVRFDGKIDIVLSSLTLKHIYPSFEGALANLTRYANAGATFVFDLIEGRRQYFENDGVTFVRWYGKDEVQGILERIGLQLVTFDTVEHDSNHTRMLVVATSRCI